MLLLVVPQTKLNCVSCNLLITITSYFTILVFRQNSDSSRVLPAAIFSISRQKLTFGVIATDYLGDGRPTPRGAWRGRGGAAIAMQFAFCTRPLPIARDFERTSHWLENAKTGG